MIVKNCGTPEQPLVGVTVIVAVMGEALAFVAIKLAMLPVPPAGKPIAVFVFVHAKVAPFTELVNVIAPVCAPAQNILSAGTVTSGAGLTVMFFVMVVSPHSFVSLSEMV